MRNLADNKFFWGLGLKETFSRTSIPSFIRFQSVTGTVKMSFEKSKQTQTPYNKDGPKMTDKKDNPINIGGQGIFIECFAMINYMDV